MPLPEPLAKPSPSTSAYFSGLAEQFRSVRGVTESICASLVTEDYGIQSMPDVSPPKWHLAHTSWFFEAFILLPFFKNYQTYHPQFHYLFNSYYKTMGKHHPRTQRGHLSRPTVEEVYRYRAYVNRHILELLESSLPEKSLIEIHRRVELGLHHEQQHQELLLMDIKHIFFSNPLRPAYPTSEINSPTPGSDLHWIEFSEGLHSLGFTGKGFAYDHEKPKHQIYLEAYCLGSHLVTNGEYLEFMESGGYQKSEYWLSDGWDHVQKENWQAPFYWEKISGSWHEKKLGAMQEVSLHIPVCHISFFEADAFARWKGKRLPTEAEWENAALELDGKGNFLEKGFFHPLASDKSHEPQEKPHQMFGDLWEFTSSAYRPYPGFKPEEGSIGEYNGKFMNNQLVLRGGVCVTPQTHIRPTYRNYFYPHMRWQFSGIRLAEDL